MPQELPPSVRFFGSLSQQLQCPEIYFRIFSFFLSSLIKDLIMLLYLLFSTFFLFILHTKETTVANWFLTSEQLNLQALESKQKDWSSEAAARLVKEFLN